MSKIKTSLSGTVYPFLDARTPMADSPLLPVKLSVTLNNAQFRIGLKMYSTPEIFDKVVVGKGIIIKAVVDHHFAEPCFERNNSNGLFISF